MSNENNRATINEVDHYHGHTSYLAVYVALLVIFVLSLLVGISDSNFALYTIFSMAIIKALLVVGYFMHLLWEPLFLSIVVGFAVLCLFFLFFGVMPDVIFVKAILGA